MEPSENSTNSGEGRDVLLIRHLITGLLSVFLVPQTIAASAVFVVAYSAAEHLLLPGSFGDVSCETTTRTTLSLQSCRGESLVCIVWFQSDASPRIEYLLAHTSEQYIGAAGLHALETDARASDHLLLHGDSRVTSDAIRTERVSGCCALSNNSSSTTSSTLSRRRRSSSLGEGSESSASCGRLRSPVALFPLFLLPSSSTLWQSARRCHEGIRRQSAARRRGSSRPAARCLYLHSLLLLRPRRSERALSVSSRSAIGAA
ncbi:hypothetical protein PMAYCL1PPCAC_25262 [Pristionchus mayeri]|uniref:Uncharacterized protein n=1 Tax=Pristionchus mayeri TaxID=1317129 RepID=A0AAN5D2W2_9BILA|nr:hypothetical protein PMAYCL1PPCAC_25262 [Pristionchus mayeri]